MAQPVWTRPAWITAIVALVSIFLTIPQIIGDYMAKQQDIKIAEQKTEAINLKNRENRQDQEFKIVSNILAQQGAERIFLLRYLAATLDDEAAQKWAQAETNRLDQLTLLNEKVKVAEKELQLKHLELEELATGKRAEKEKLNNEINILKQDLASKNTEVILQQQAAGLKPSLANPPSGLYRLEKTYGDYAINLGFWGKESSESVTLVMLFSDRDTELVKCPNANRCEPHFTGPLPYRIMMTPPLFAADIYAIIGTATEDRFTVGYSCNQSSSSLMTCNLMEDDRFHRSTTTPVDIEFTPGSS